MKTFVPFLFSLFALLLQSSCAGSAYTWKTRRPRYRYRNYRLVGHVINTIHGNVAIVTQCALACLRDDKCRSFNFFEHRRRCELNDRSHVTKARDKKWSRGCVYYARDAFSINTRAIGDKNLVCLHGGVKVTTRRPSGRHVTTCACADEWTGRRCETKGQRHNNKLC
ncbi:hypothetical protein NP493_723g02010 [Ridgeia piscesae]|uniref:Apple domain-containing protein n=1 Tax=Ridgeia piscesae TaxID=27915 RepID=A0AAD9KRJ6_RIDPI|nr:hypothetical protein NP493_723g02010 [Ridgeia piscesae]